MIISTLIKRSNSSRNGVKKELCCTSVVTTRDSYLISPSDLLALVLRQGDPLTLLLNQTNYCDKKQT